MRHVLLILAIVATVLLFGAGYAGPARLSLWRAQPDLRAIALPTPAILTNGRLTWLGGARLVSGDPASGGYSALAIRRGRFLVLNDGGNYIGFALRPGWRIADARFGALPDGPRLGWEKRDRDAESLTPAGGAGAGWWVGFESANALWRYSADLGRVEAHGNPPAMRGWNRAGGPESLVRLGDGGLLALAETARWPDSPGRAGFVFVTDPTRPDYRGYRFHYLPAAGFSPSDAALLPNGDVVVLERWWGIPYRFRSRLVRVPRGRIGPEAIVRGIELGRIAPPWPTENYEGIAITRERGATIVLLVSDNDQALWRNSYLLKLRLD